jgi:hypothetical protein
VAGNEEIGRKRRRSMAWMLEGDACYLNLKPIPKEASAPVHHHHHLV